MGQHVDERRARGDSQDLDETKASHCTGDVSSALAARVQRTREWRRRGADTARKAKSCHVISEEQLWRKQTHRIQNIMEIPRLKYTDEKVGVSAESSEDSADAAGPVHHEAG